MGNGECLIHTTVLRSHSHTESEQANNLLILKVQMYNDVLTQMNNFWKTSGQMKLWYQRVQESYITKQERHFGVRYGDINLPFCLQISHTIDHREILFSHNILKDIPENDIFAHFSMRNHN